MAALTEADLEPPNLPCPCQTLNELTTPTVIENPVIPRPTPPVTPNTQAPLATPHTPRALRNLVNYNRPRLLE